MEDMIANVKESDIIKVEEQGEIIKANKIENMIYEIRGKQVILDKDLALLYNCANGAKTINQAVKRHQDRFPSEFYFQLNSEESKNILRSQQAGTLELKQGKYPKYLPYAFTEEGVAMLSTVLRTKNAAVISICIMKVFVAMRKYISNSLIEQRYINDLVIKHDKRLELLENTFDKFKVSNNEIYFNGQIYDAYSKITDIMSASKKELIIIDGYADKSVLDMIKNLKVKVTLICKTKTLLKPLDIEKYNKEYDNLNIIYNDDYHDRYLILDQKEVYHLGASINHAGSKTFSINKLEDKVLIESLLKNVNTIL